MGRWCAVLRGQAQQAHIGRNRGQQGVLLTSDEPAEFGRQALQHFFRCLLQRGLQGLGAGQHPVAGLVQRVDHDGAQLFLAGVGIQQLRRGQGLQHGAVLLRVHTAQLDIRTIRQLQRSAAIAGGQLRQQHGLRRAQSAQRGAHAHDQPIARSHGLPGARAPALDARRRGGHVGFHVENCGGIARADP